MHQWYKYTCLTKVHTYIFTWTIYARLLGLEEYWVLKLSAKSNHEIKLHDHRK